MHDARPDGTGTVAALWRYPVKSMAGESLRESQVDDRGLLGDRGRALVADDGAVVSAKYPHRWGATLHWHAAYLAPPRPGGELPEVRVTFPDGTVVDSGAVDFDRHVTKALGHEVRLSSVPPAVPVMDRLVLDEGGEAVAGAVTRDGGTEALAPGTFFDYGRVHLVTTATVRRMAEARGRTIEPGRLRPNVVVDAGAAVGFVENTWTGHTLAIGDEVALRVLGPTPRCVVPTLEQPAGPADPRLLQVLARHNRVEAASGRVRACAGVYADVVRAGTVRVGDVVRLA